MTRSEKIEALLKEFRSNEENQFDTMAAYKLGILAGIKLRDAELLAMEFDEDNIKRLIEIPLYNFPKHKILVIETARWYHSKLLGKIKEDKNASQS